MMPLPANSRRLGSVIVRYCYIQCRQNKQGHGGGMTILAGLGQAPKTHLYLPLCSRRGHYIQFHVALH